VTTAFVKCDRVASTVAPGCRSMRVFGSNGLPAVCVYAVGRIWRSGPMFSSAPPAASSFRCPVEPDGLDAVIVRFVILAIRASTTSSRSSVSLSSSVVYGVPHGVEHCTPIVISQVSSASTSSAPAGLRATSWLQICLSSPSITAFCAEAGRAIENAASTAVEPTRVT
jgi:hypothetical protein